MLRSRSLRFALYAVSTCVTSCAPSAPLVPAAVPTPAVSEEALRAEERPDIAIIDLDETVGPDQHVVTVTGTLVNRGTGATRALFVRVEALNRDGAVVARADAEPTVGVIPPGATARFSVLLENRGDVDRYHVEALAR